MNVIHSDGTVAFFNEHVSGGTSLTIENCKLHNKTSLLINISACKTSEAVMTLQEFVHLNDIRHLNIAGPRASDCPKMYDYVRAVIFALVKATED
tara:strand:+ start:5685 stop:5969 length:285 start_codon:yes stop_codon:yes gene_type:complete